MGNILRKKKQGDNTSKAIEYINVNVVLLGSKGMFPTPIIAKYYPPTVFASQDNSQVIFFIGSHWEQRSNSFRPNSSRRVDLFHVYPPYRPHFRFHAPFTLWFQIRSPTASIIIIIDSGKNQIMTAFNAGKGVDPLENKEIEFIQKIVHIKEDDETLHFKFKVQEPIDYKKFCAIANTYYQETTAVVLVFDPSSQESYDAVENYFIDISYFNPKKINLPLLLVCNNKGQGTRVITEEQGKALATKLQIPYHEANSTAYENVEDIFSFCAREGILKGAITRNVPESTSFAMERH